MIFIDSNDNEIYIKKSIRIKKNDVVKFELLFDTSV